MMWAITAWRFLTSGIGRWIAAAGAIALAIVGIRADAKRDARRDAKAKAAEDTLRRTDAGRAAAEKAKAEMADGKAPDDVVRQNDGAWR